jgi:long-chain fatty acid transport protein
VLSIVLAFVGSAHAGGYYYPDSGVIANGRGCAMAAGADGQFAQYYNPAGLVRMKRPTLNIGYSAIKQAVTFDRWEDPPPGEVDGQIVDPEPFFYPTAKNEGGRFGVPELGFATPIGKNFGFAFGFTSGFAPDYVFDAAGPQRYTIIDNLIWNFQIGPSLAWRPVPAVSIGLGLQWQVLRVNENLKVTTSGSDDPAGDVNVVARVWDKFTPGFNAGVIVEPVPQLSIGVSVQPATKYKARGDGKLDFTDWGSAQYLDKPVWTDDDIGLNLDIPTFLRTGVAVRPVDGLELEADFDYETWSSLADITVTDIDVVVTGPGLICNPDSGGCPVADTIALPAGFQDAFSVRLGAEYAIGEIAHVRAGGFYESSSLDVQSVSVALVDTPKFMEGAGASLYLLKDHNLVIDGYASFIEYKNLEIRDSTVSQINVYGGGESIVGNGDIKSFGSAFGGAVRWQFGKEPAAP